MRSGCLRNPGPGREASSRRGTGRAPILMTNARIYVVNSVATAPAMAPDWNDPAWAQVAPAEVDYFLPESSPHRPRTRVRLVRDALGLHGLFQVHDRFVRCLRTEYFNEVWKDSCVEFFVEPKPGAGYFNFEFNCGGAFLCSHITNP